MSKHDVLTEAEFRRFRINPRTLDALEAYQRRSGRAPADTNVLDWGCGRGREVLWLRERGYQAFGVDVDAEPLRNGAPLFLELGHDPSVLRRIAPDGGVEFADGFFHFVFSDQVLEHVRDLDAVAREQRRVLAPDGEAFHQYPAHRRIVEVHLGMPFVHWLPKTRLRRLLIGGYVRAGREPGWDWLAGRGAREKADAYHAYSVDHTFYRSSRCVRRIFERHGFRAAFATIDHPKLRAHPLLGPLTRLPLLRPLASRLLLTFQGVELRLS